MTQHEFESAVDDFLSAEHAEGRRVRSISDFPASLRALCDGDEARMKWLAGVLAIESAWAIHPSPAPNEGFRDRVMSALRSEGARPSGVAYASRLKRFASLTAAGIAAGVLMMVALPRVPVVPTTTEEVAATTPAEMDVPAETVRRGTLAYMELVDDVVASVQPISSMEAAEDFQVAAASPVSQAIHGSGETIRSAGEGVRVSVQPITDSALNAFGFLWKPTSSSLDQPST